MCPAVQREEKAVRCSSRGTGYSPIDAGLSHQYKPSIFPRIQETHLVASDDQLGGRHSPEMLQPALLQQGADGTAMCRDGKSGPENLGLVMTWVEALVSKYAVRLTTQSTPCMKCARAPYGLRRALACTGFTAIRLRTFRSAALSGRRAAPAEAQAGLRAARRS